MPTQLAGAKLDTLNIPMYTRLHICMYVDAARSTYNNEIKN